MLVGTYDQLRRSHRGWIDEHLGDGAKSRQEEWTDSIAVGSESFVEEMKRRLGFKAKGRDVVEGSKGYNLREEAAPYTVLFRPEKDDIGPENTYLGDANTE
jgi:putative transposase